MTPERRLVRSFPVKDEEGYVHTLEEHVEIHDETCMDGKPREREGIREITTRDGEPVNRIKKGKYQIAATGETLTSDDPQAP